MSHNYVNCHNQIVICFTEFMSASRTKLVNKRFLRNLLLSKTEINYAEVMQNTGNLK